MHFTFNYTNKCKCNIMGQMLYYSEKFMLNRKFTVIKKVYSSLFYDLLLKLYYLIIS